MDTETRLDHYTGFVRTTSVGEIARAANQHKTARVAWFRKYPRSAPLDAILKERPVLTERGLHIEMANIMIGSIGSRLVGLLERRVAALRGR